MNHLSYRLLSLALLTCIMILEAFTSNDLALTSWHWISVNSIWVSFSIGPDWNNAKTTWFSTYRHRWLTCNITELCCTNRHRWLTCNITDERNCERRLAWLKTETSLCTCLWPAQALSRLLRCETWWQPNSLPMQKAHFHVLCYFHVLHSTICFQQKFIS